MKFLLICGSIAKKAHTKALLIYLKSLLEDKNHEVILWDLKDKPLAIALPEYHKNPWDSPDEIVREFIKVVKESDGFILGSPLYHGSYSGVLKNALDNLHFDAFKGKPVGLVSNSSNTNNAIIPCDHLRLVTRALYGYALQTQIGTDGSQYKEFEDKYELIDEGIKERCERMVNELIHLTSVLSNKSSN